MVIKLYYILSYVCAHAYVRAFVFMYSYIYVIMTSIKRGFTLQINIVLVLYVKQTPYRQYPQ
jgi:hypothetical protein